MKDTEQSATLIGASVGYTDRLSTLLSLYILRSDWNTVNFTFSWNCVPLNDVLVLLFLFILFHIRNSEALSLFHAQIIAFQAADGISISAEGEIRLSFVTVPDVVRLLSDHPHDSF